METVTQQIGAFVRDNGGNAWDALNVALARLDLATAEIEQLRVELATAKAEGANEERSLHWMKADAEVQRLRDENESLREQLDEATTQIESMWKTIAP